MRNKEKEVNTDLSGKASSSDKVVQSTMEYAGPDYGSAIVLPGAGKCDPKTWDENKLKYMLETYPEISRYFKRRKP